MRVVLAIDLKSRITRMVWLGNATMGTLMAMLGAVMVWNVFGYDAQMAPLMERTGVAFAVTGMALALISMRRIGLSAEGR
jgi:hypothetical protein